MTLFIYLLNFFFWVVMLGHAIWRGSNVYLRRRSSKSEMTNPQKEWEYSRKVCLQIAPHAQNRLTTSGVLAGLSVAAFAALFAALPSTQRGLNWLPGEDDLVFLDAAFVLAIATLTFLAATLSAYQVVRRITHISQQSTELLLRCDKGEPQQLGNDLKKLEEVYQLHEEADGSITWGLLELAIALLFIAFQISIIVGAAAVLWMLVIACSRPTLWGAGIRELC